MMFKNVFAIVFVLAVSLTAHSQTGAFDEAKDVCIPLAETVAKAQEHVDYARNAWLNRESVCEADLNKENCFEYLKNDYQAAKAELKNAKMQYRRAGCAQ